MTTSLCLMTVLTFLGCKSTSEEHVHKGHAHPSATTAVNRMCPIMDEPVDPEVPTVGYKGHTIGFCCEDCPPKWNGLSTAQKDEHLKKVLSR